MPSTPETFPATDRFTLIRRIGAGGMGVVYEAIDRQRGLTVAVKTLPQLDAQTLLRFKDEFRTLADIAHPNLATLHELMVVGDRWCFTMELVGGVSFLDYVRPPSVARPRAALDSQQETVMPAATEAALATGVERSVAPGPMHSGALDVARLRHVLPQVAAGLAALHEAGKLHCDIKPSNVLVTPEGRVVILDFGVAQSLEHQTRAVRPRIAGTVAYMAPEQAAGRSLGPAVDSYALGVMLWEAAVGRLPFTGTTLDILRDKQVLTPPAPRQVTPDVPDDLSDLCARLLAHGPEHRLVARDLLAELTGTPASPARRAARDETPLVGRDRHLSVLREAFTAVVAGRAVVLVVRGASGMGKSTLIGRFLDEIRHDTDAVVVSGRCYENESVPYKAVDSVIDQLGHHLAESADTGAVLPPDAGLLAQLFPVLGPVVDVAPAVADQAPDVQVTRRRAFGAFRSLLSGLGQRRPLVVHVDDLHWGDVDSAILLSNVLRGPDPPTMLFLASFRSDEAESSACVRTLRQEEAFLNAPVLELDGLNELDSVHLADALLRASGQDPDQAEQIAAEARGNPYFVHELVERLRHVRADPTDRLETHGVTLDGALRDRIENLPADARRLLEVVAVSGQPLSDGDAFSAARLPARDLGVLGTLRKLRFVRTTGPTDRLTVDTYHDRIRETLLGTLSPTETSQHHRQLALSLAASGDADDETLARHWEGAGELARAARHYVRAADAATATLTFDHAAQLYRRALMNGLGDEARAAVQVRLGEALANAGRCHEAALAYEEAAASTGAPGLLERAAHLYCLSGYADEGRALFDRLFREAGLRLPPTPASSVRMLVWDRLVLAFRGLKPAPLRQGPAAAREAERIDLVWAAATGLMEFDPITGAALQGRGLRLALRHGEPSRIARALAISAMFTAQQGVESKPQLEALLKQARDLTNQADRPINRALVALAEGMAYWLNDKRWDAAEQVFDEAEQVLRREPAARTWEMAALHSHRIWMHYFRGHLRTSVDYSQEVIREARERGNVYQSVNLGILAGGYAGLMADDPAQARERIFAAGAALPQKVTSIQHVMQMIMDLLIETYSASPSAWGSLTNYWPDFVSTHQLRMAQMRIQMHHLRARCALTTLATASDPAPLLKEAQRMAAKLAKEKAPWAKAESQIVRAGLASWHGERGVAAALLDEAARTLEALDLGQTAVPTRRQQGVLLGGERGKAMVEAADQALARQGIRAPDKWARMWVTIPDPRASAHPTT